MSYKISGESFGEEGGHYRSVVFLLSVLSTQCSCSNCTVLYFNFKFDNKLLKMNGRVLPPEVIYQREKKVCLAWNGSVISSL